MRQWIGSALVQIMACLLWAPFHYLNQHLVIVNWTLRNKLQWNFNQNTKFCINANASENIVCEMVAILCRGRWVIMFRILTTKLDRRCNEIELEHLPIYISGNFANRFLQEKPVIWPKSIGLSLNIDIFKMIKLNLGSRYDENMPTDKNSF